MGGVPTQYASWRWCLLVNVPLAAVAALASVPVVRESKSEGNTSYDIPGAVTVTAGLVALVYGFTKAGSDGWTATATLSSLGIAVVLLAAFVTIEIKSKNPLLPTRVILERNRGAPSSARPWPSQPCSGCSYSSPTTSRGTWK
jgi:MFS family permease